MPFNQGRHGNCVLLKKLLETSGTFLLKAVLLHLHSFPITKLHLLQLHCFAAVEIVSQIQKTPCSGVPSSHGLCCKAITHWLLCENWQISTLEIGFGSLIFALGWLPSLHDMINLRWRTKEVWDSECRVFLTLRVTISCFPRINLGFNPLFVVPLWPRQGLKSLNHSLHCPPCNRLSLPFHCLD